MNYFGGLCPSLEQKLMQDEHVNSWSQGAILNTLSKLPYLNIKQHPCAEDHILLSGRTDDNIFTGTSVYKLIFYYKFWFHYTESGESSLLPHIQHYTMINHHFLYKWPAYIISYSHYILTLIKLIKLYSVLCFARTLVPLHSRRSGIVPGEYGKSNFIYRVSCPLRLFITPVVFSLSLS